jgi:hypothetical protein
MRHLGIAALMVIGALVLTAAAASFLQEFKAPIEGEP